MIDWKLDWSRGGDRTGPGPSIAFIDELSRGARGPGHAESCGGEAGQAAEVSKLDQRRRTRRRALSGTSRGSSPRAHQPGTSVVSVGLSGDAGVDSPEDFWAGEASDRGMPEEAR